MGGNIFDYNLGGSGGMPPRSFFWCFRTLRQLLVQSEAKILTELLNICEYAASLSVCTGILIQILIQTGCVYTEARQTGFKSTSPMWIGDPDSNLDSGPGARVNVAIDQADSI